MKRKIIQIDPELCDGCGLCVDACAEGAIQMVDGKATLVKDEYCDGLGECIGDCPQGALRVIEREAAAFDEQAVTAHLARTRVPVPPELCGCPGSAVRTLEPPPRVPAAAPATDGLPARVQPSDLTHWPVQLHLVPTRAAFFAHKELVVLSTCAPVASADVHWRFLRGRSVVVACPKLDRTEPYVDKLASIFSSNSIPKVLVVRMQVPCCGGLSRMVQLARDVSGIEVPVEEIVVSVDGSILGARAL